jgi:DNA-directed RNA polymerase specialized sigma24 family protein
MDHLYTLAFLLTADHELTERCFLVAFEDCVDGISIFKNWAFAWSRRAVVKSAVQMVRSEKRDGPDSPRLAKECYESAGRELADAITGLPQMERFAYVLTVLERYTDRECSLLLDSTAGEVIGARNRALEHLTDTLIASEFVIGV